MSHLFAVKFEEGLVKVTLAWKSEVLFALSCQVDLDDFRV